MRTFLIFLFLFTINCSTNKVANVHGYRSLDVKYNKITLNESNKNDIKGIIGPPSSVSDFNQNVWFFIERRKTNQSLLKLGNRKINVNNILVLEFNNLGIVIDKKLLDLNDMNDVKITKKTTEKDFEQDNFLYNVFSSVREKINAPAKNRQKIK